MRVFARRFLVAVVESGVDALVNVYAHPTDVLRAEDVTAVANIHMAVSEARLARAGEIAVDVDAIGVNVAIVHRRIGALIDVCAVLTRAFDALARMARALETFAIGQVSALRKHGLTVVEHGVFAFVDVGAAGAVSLESRRTRASERSSGVGAIRRAAEAVVRATLALVDLNARVRRPKVAVSTDA